MSAALRLDEMVERAVDRYLATPGSVSGAMRAALDTCVPELLAEVERLREQVQFYGFCMNTAGLDDLKRRAFTAEAALLAQSAAYEALVLRAYQEGWHECAEWAGRDDLHPDVDSKAYADARDERLKRISEEEIRE